MNFLTQVNRSAGRVIHFCGMKAVIYKKYGGPETLQLADIEKPQPGKKEVLIKVAATTVTAGDTWMRKGAYPGSFFFTVIIRLMFGIWRPRRQLLGAEFAGVVEQVGAQVTGFKKGDQVYGTTTGLKIGAYAEYICIPERWKQGVLALKPKCLNMQEAAALPVAGMTAVNLLKKASIKEGQKVLIYGASGSVGTAAIQVAKYTGANVTAVCSEGNAGLVQQIGADRVIGYEGNRFAQLTERFDMVLDAVGKLSPARGRQLLATNGTYCSVRTYMPEKYSSLIQLHQMIAQGKFKPVIDREYRMIQMAEAHRYVDTGRKKGNVIITTVHE